MLSKNQVVAVKKALESTYDSVCSVVIKAEKIDPLTHRTKMEDVPLMGDIPCRLSYSTVKSAGAASPAAIVAQSIKLFLSNEHAVPSGSKIEVTQNETTTIYKQSGQPAKYNTHQEITLELVEVA